MDAAARIAANYYEREWTVVVPCDDYDQAELDALVAAGKLEYRADVQCIEGHTVYGNARTTDEARANLWRGAECHTCTDDERSDDPADCMIAVRAIMTEAWRKELDAANPWVACEHCGGEGKVRSLKEPTP